MAVVTGVSPLRLPRMIQTYGGSQKGLDQLVQLLLPSSPIRYTSSPVKRWRSRGASLLEGFPLGNMKPGEVKSPANNTYARILPGLGSSYLWHCDLVRWLAVGAPPPPPQPAALCCASPLKAFPAPPSSRGSLLSASDVQFRRDLLMLHAALGTWALVGSIEDRERDADTLQIL